MSTYPRHAGVEQAVLEAHELEQTPFFGALARRYGAGKARELTLAATAGRWNAENNGPTHDEAKARLFVHNALLSAGVTDAEAATISQSFPLSEFDRKQIAHNGSAASLGHITAQAAAKVEEQKAHKKYNDLTALMAGTASDHQAKPFFDRRGQTALDRAGSGGEGRRGDYSSMGEYDPQRGTGDFDKSAFAKVGLDAALTRSLAQQGFSKQNILAAANDTKALGFSPNDKEAVKDFAALDRVDHEGRDERNNAYKKYAAWLKEHKEQLQKLQEEAKRDAEKRRELELLLEEGRNKTGWNKYTNRLENKPVDRKDPKGKQHKEEAISGHKRIQRRLEKKDAGLSPMASAAPDMQRKEEHGAGAKLATAQKKSSTSPSAQL